MLDKQHIPLFVFVACLALALALAFFTNEWPTALAISLAGVALGLAMRPPLAEYHDTAFLEEDIQDIREANGRQDAELSEIRKLIDDLAEIVEAVAADASLMRQSGGMAQQDDGLREQLVKLDERFDALEQPQREVNMRIDRIEEAVLSLRDAETTAARKSSVIRNPVANLRKVAMSAGRKGGSLMDAAVTMPEQGKTAEKHRNDIASTVRRLPVLTPDSDTPVSMLIDDVSDNPSGRGAVAVLRHALEYSMQSDDSAGRLFVRLRADAVGSEAVQAAMNALASDGRAHLNKLVIMVPQAAVRDGIHSALGDLIKAGCEFGLEQMTDWSIDLGGLSDMGLRYILVDGPAMARSAAAQKGDPTRLKTVLASHGISLIAANIENRMQLDAVSALVPDMIAGTGLVEPVMVDVA